MNMTRKPGKYRGAILALSDTALAELITALKFNTKIEQSALATAIAEKRRRARRKAMEVTS